MTSHELPPGTEEADEAGSLAMELARAYREMTAFYHEQMEMSVLDATSRARGRDVSPEDAAEDTARIQARPPDQVSWFELNRLADRGPEQMITLWSKIRDAANKELATGHRAAHALEWQGRPWDRARYLAIRQSFQSSHPPPKRDRIGAARYRGRGLQRPPGVE
jgi:hypothetical protein